MTNRRKVARGIFVPVFLVFMGMIAFSNAASKPSFETFRAVDVVRLIAVGMCFGAALVALIMFFRRDRSN
ncbi:MAG TPA: hypothetical protein VK129_06585 [Terriglobales bacterium]|nr:hypothetical protein [Terriglobales bacterium]